MPSKSLSIVRALVFALASASLVLPALADPPDGQNKQRRKNQGQGQFDPRDDFRDRRDDFRGRDDRGRVDSGSRRDDRRDDRRAHREHRREHFADNHRTIVHEYYRESWRSGRCPPGLAKKRNGCLPPGQARRWEYGRRLPRDVIFYDVPPALVVEIGVPPPGHRYVRVAGDILLIAIGTAIVVDAIEDLGR